MKSCIMHLPYVAKYLKFPYISKTNFLAYIYDDTVIHHGDPHNATP